MNIDRKPSPEDSANDHITAFEAALNRDDWFDTIKRASYRAFLAEMRRLRAENEALLAALHKIHEIRNDIIRTQKLGWSAHVYPLVAALGQVGLTYEDAAIEADDLNAAQAAKERT